MRSRVVGAEEDIDLVRFRCFQSHGGIGTFEHLARLIEVVEEDRKA